MFVGGEADILREGEAVNINERMKLSWELRERLTRFGDQKAMLDGLLQASQQLWSDDEMRCRCDQLMRDLAREMVKNAQRIWDVSAEARRTDDQGATSMGEARDESIPW